MPVMNVALATATASRPVDPMTARGAKDAGTGADAPIRIATGTAEPLTNRYPIVAFSYDTDASRLVMLFRDPADGKTVSQIPTEAALKQYKEAQQKEKEAERASALKMVVGGAGDGGQGGSSGAGSGGSSASRSATNGAAGKAAVTTAAAPPSGGAPFVAQSSVSTTHQAAVAVAGAAAGAGGSTGSARVNVVI
ncbi:hypothetical protein [Azospirillum thermophilum]|uniref:Uncharacterized protein n=1 Tax=Azospirillum thermophilum TaxID=2202148 RepID=A0A2S2CLU3_9PROT|nr:hypothetical protein [Azospirillum thermophilum]AWK85483.1 hypothetical protein DEW08_04265 [Azospirillum thermophilum]